MQLNEISSHLGLIASSLPLINDEKTIQEYKQILSRSLDTLEDISSIEIGISLIEAWARIQQCLLVRAISAISHSGGDRQGILDFIAALKAQKQTAQRTVEWYEQGKRILTASEIYSLFRAPRARAQMVFSKVETTYRMNQSHAVKSNRMTAFDWGIRFEPVVKQIFELGLKHYALSPANTVCSASCEHAHHCQVEELGRIMHPTDPRVAASPDGLVTTGPDHLLGHLIEIKAPVTREIGLGIPDEYYAQIQTQLEVTGARACEYIEMKFNSPYNTGGDPAKAQPQPSGPPLYYGYIYLIKSTPADSEDNIFAEGILSYVYGPVNSDDQPEFNDPTCQVIEKIPWQCMGWSHHIVPRRQDWWASIQPAIEQFWVDVEGARNGTFILPASTRQPKKVPSSSTDQPTLQQLCQDDIQQTPTPQME